MNSIPIKWSIAILLSGSVLLLAQTYTANTPMPANRQEVVFWHFWGGQDRDVVDDVVDRFNQSQRTYFVRAVALPGNNLQAKLFLAIAGSDPPDLVNQDDPILADWSKRGVLQSFETIASNQEMADLKRWMFPAALRLSTVDSELFAVCNGLDIRAMYYNATELERFGLTPPETLDELNHICDTISPAAKQRQATYAFLPDSRGVWGWGFVFGADFYRDRNVRLATPELIAALTWMSGFSGQYGADNVAAFRQGDQSLPGKSFPLLPVQDAEMSGRYVLLIDGQWRTRDIANFTARRRQLGIPSPKFGVCPLPYPENGRNNAGWVNGNFFVVPRGARNPAGAWEFVKFWIGLEQPEQAAKTCATGGWIPVSESVVKHPEFQSFLKQDPMFAQFVNLASSPNQFPIPMVQGASFLKRTVEAAAYEAMIYPNRPASEILLEAETRIQSHFDAQQPLGAAADAR